MNAELEALVLALEAVLQARAGEDANQMALYSGSNIICNGWLSVLV